MCKTLSQMRCDFLKSPAKVLLFAHTAKQIAQNQLICAQTALFVQFYIDHC